IEHYGYQILGNFSPFVYTLATKALPRFLTLLLNTLSLKSLKRLVTLSRSNIHENIFLSGHMAWARKLSQKGTLVFTPTYVSNLDSIVMGIALFYADLPPVMYGAGLNLFKNKLIGYFMDNLGAYKVDRLRIHPLYKDVLKEYAACSMELGYHNLYFPGGTRSRSGAVEKRSKDGWALKKKFARFKRSFFNFISNL
ncbi:MAG: 1-acyl-sn-glycerol-3-phosphate acyltransferase, partial [Deltaproteobacteria bacterium]|nr:1-acyl-sn-glycerol-3-phosphate acyltransferase [Deltaproteobacteria bacterium]